MLKKSGFPGAGLVKRGRVYDCDSHAAENANLDGSQLRPGARSFGEPTAGVPTGNSPHRLTDGAELHLTEAVGVDRTGRSHQTRIKPDQPVATDWTRYGSPADPVLQAAIAWLDMRCSRSG